MPVQAAQAASPSPIEVLAKIEIENTPHYSEMTTLMPRIHA
jgi:hypothetical protein